jgi:hypothetical protein
VIGDIWPDAGNLKEGSPADMDDLGSIKNLLLAARRSMD